MGVSDVWFRVTDLEVASGHGSVVTTTDGTEYLDFSSGIAVTSTGHCHPHVVAAIQEQAARFIHAQVNVYRHTRLAELADRLAAIAPDGHRHVLLRQLRRRGHRGRGEAGQAGHRSPERDRVPGQLPRPHAPGHGHDDLEDRVPRRSRARCPPACSWRPFPKADDEVDACLDAVRLLLLSQTAPAETAAMLIEPVLGEGGYVPRPTAFLTGSRRSAASTGSSSSPTRCRAASGAPARCSASSSTACRPTSW